MEIQSDARRPKYDAFESAAGERAGARRNSELRAAGLGDARRGGSETGGARRAEAGARQWLAGGLVVVGRATSGFHRIFRPTRVYVAGRGASQGLEPSARRWILEHSSGRDNPVHDLQ